MIKLPIQYRLVEDPSEVSGAKGNAAPVKQTETVDMSLCGMNISVDKPLKMGTILRVDFSLPESTKTLTFFAEVVLAGPNGVGPRFIMGNNNNAKLLKAGLDKVSTTP